MGSSTPLSLIGSSPPKAKPLKKSRKRSGRKSWKKSVGKKVPTMSVGIMRQRVHELSKDSKSAYAALKKWNKEDLLEVLRVESGETKLFNNWNKGPIIHELLKIVSEENDLSTPSTSKMSVDEKRQLVHEMSDSAVDALNKSNNDEHLEVLPVEPGEKNGEINNEPSTTSTSSRRKKSKPTRYTGSSDKTKGTTICSNLVCLATMKWEDSFCKRCTCYICRESDDENKDHSLWLTCDSDPSFPGESCGLTCHLECAIKNEKSGLKEDNPSYDVDGCFYCVFCGKKNTLLECWKWQLFIAMETTAVYVLCFRLLMAQKLLKGTEKYKKLSEPVEEAVKSLETELRGPLDDLPLTMRTKTIKELDSAPKVKELCYSALKALQDIRLVYHALPSKMPETTSGTKQTSVEETKVSTKPSQEEEGQGQEEATVVNSLSKNGEEEQLALKETVPEKPVNKGKSSSSCGFGLEDCVKILRQLESLGYVDTNFRQKFLTWYSLSASAQEKNIVNTFADVFRDDPVALAEQLVDSFSEHIRRKRSATGRSKSSV